MAEREITASWESYSLPRLFAMFLSPLALPKPHPIRSDMNAAARRHAMRANQRHVQAHLGAYIDRSARGIAGCMIAYLISLHLLGIPLLVMAAGFIMLAAFVHVAVLIFWKQHLDDRFGPVEPPE
ncbi:hypothetical protein [Thiohalomonas denitrificans]|uniref:Uncharacterized protein n=1 Tax=Thiohalomonas denitrificans TaxID=415747 RepID=A0A1G5Q1P9_9GAMM|nr:hypothetical protein [Thiohalomonas denitrificans]SCZ55239.1 hypothetical protein SAMN03097708_01094 [Thiohalomonas denitrificans]